MPTDHTFSGSTPTPWRDDPNIELLREKVYTAIARYETTPGKTYDDANLALDALCDAVAASPSRPAPSDLCGENGCDGRWRCAVCGRER